MTYVTKSLVHYQKSIIINGWPWKQASKYSICKVQRAHWLLTNASKFIAELQGPPSGAPYPYRKLKETHETTVSIVTIHVGVKIFIPQDPNLASGRELLDTPGRFYLTPDLKQTNGQRPWRLLSDYWWNTILLSFYIISVQLSYIYIYIFSIL